MAKKPTYEELEQRVKELENEAVEGKRKEEALRESGERLRTITDTALDSIFCKDINRRYTFVNPSMLQLMGCTKADLIGKVPEEVFDKEGAAIVNGVDERTLNGENISEVRSLSIAGKPYIFHTIQVPLRNSDGNITGISGIVRDITDFVQAQEALRESAEKYRNIFNNAQVGIFRTRISDGKVLECNDRFARMHGYKTPEECIDDFVVSERYRDPNVREKMVASLMEKGEVDNREACVSRKDGKDVWIRFSARAYPEEGYLEGVGYDITEEKKTLAALQESESQKMAILDASLDRIRLVDRDLRIIWANKKTTRELDIAPEELVGEICYELFAERDTPCPGCPMIKALKSGKIEHAVLHQTKSKGIPGESYWDTYAVPIKDESDNIVNLIEVSRNITERKKAEEEKERLEAQLQRAQKMEAMGLLAGGVAHDLNNILSGIVTYPELLLMDLPKDSHLRRPIETIQESGMRAVDVVADLLTIARGVASSKEPLNLNSMIGEYLNSPEHKKLEKIHSFVEFKTDLDPDLLNMRGSPSHIKKTLMNLIANATEAIEGSGTVTISTQNRYVDELLKGYENVRIGEYTVVSMSDDGAGISPEDIERIFEPFYTKKMMGRSGTGLGLAVVWNTVQDHNGYININTSEKGTVFELYFPVTRDEVPDKKEEVPLKDYLGHGEKVLVVDDEERQREIACWLLTKLGYVAEAVSSGEEAIKYLKEHPVDLIILDMVMPKGINGRKTYEEIINIRPRQKAIIASGFSETEDVKIAQKLGAGKYIKKPYTLEKIGVAVKEELGK